jgi:hypothetical protein
MKSYSAFAMLALASLLSSCSPGEAPSDLAVGTSTINLASATALALSATTAPTWTRTPLPPTATAPEPYTVVTTLEQVIGTWRFSDSDFTRFYDDGTYHDAYTLARLDSDPYAVNKIEFEDGHLVAREVSVSGVPPCGGKVGIYELRLLQSGRMQIVVVKDTCGPRAADTQGIYERIQ